MGTMKTLATELEDRWNASAEIAGYQHWSRQMPDGQTAVIITDPREQAWLHIGGRLVAECEHIADALIAARAFAHVTLRELTMEWAA